MGKNSDLYNNIKTQVAFMPQALVTAVDITGNIIDTHEFESVTFVLATDSIANGVLDAALLIQEDDNASMSSPTSVASGDLIGTTASTRITSATASATHRLGYSGEMRYVRAKLDIVTNTGTDVVSCVAILGHPHYGAISAD